MKHLSIDGIMLYNNCIACHYLLLMYRIALYCNVGNRVEPSAQEQFLDNIDDDEARAIVRRCLIPEDRIHVGAELGKGEKYNPCPIL